jgi:preprotein translocase subunit YajC
MSLLSTIFSAIIPTAYAAGASTTTTGATHQQGSIWSTVIMLAVFFVIFYFLLIRPQSKRAKAQRALLESVQVGEDVVTAAGLMGTIRAIDQNIVSLEIAKDVIIKIQKNAISGTLPKGTVQEANS